MRTVAEAKRAEMRQLAFEMSHRPDILAEGMERDRALRAKLKARVKVGTILCRLGYCVNHYEVVGIKPFDRWFFGHVYDDDVLYYLKPIYSTALGNVREFWAQDNGIAVRLVDLFEVYDNLNFGLMPSGFVIAADSYAEVEAQLSDKFPSSDLRDTGMVEYMRKYYGKRSVA